MKTEKTVRNCPVDFRFVCSRIWDELRATADPDVRHCDRCESDVHFCRTDDETIAHAKAGHCIARERPDASELPRMTLGMPAEVRRPEPTATQSEAGLRDARESAIDDAIRSATRTSRACPRCSYPAPPWRTTCRVCGFGFGRVNETAMRK